MTEPTRPADAVDQQHVAVFLRFDYRVDDWERLRRAAVTALIECGVSAAEAGQRVASPTDALYALFESRPNAGDEPGAEVRVEYLTAVPVGHAGDVLEDGPWAPLFASDEDLP